MSKFNDWTIIALGGKTFVSEDGNAMVAWAGNPNEIAYLKAEDGKTVIQLDKYVIRIDEEKRAILINLG